MFSKNAYGRPVSQGSAGTIERASERKLDLCNRAKRRVQVTCTGSLRVRTPVEALFGDSKQDILAVPISGAPIGDAKDVIAGR